MSLLGLILNPSGSTACGLELRGDDLHAAGRGTVVSLGSVHSPPIVRKGLLGTTIMIKTNGQFETILRGARFSETTAFAKAVQDAWIHFNIRALEGETARVYRLLSAIEELKAPLRYPSACCLSPIFTDARALDGSLLSKIRP
jgi:DNA helicase-4